MASKSITINNTLEAIRNNIIPGLFSTDYKEFVFSTIKYANKRGDQLEWIVKVLLKKDDNVVQILDKMLDQPIYPLDTTYVAEIIVSTYQVGGKIRKTVPTIIKTGKNIGKKNETNVLTQAFRDALGMYNKKVRNNKPPPMLLDSKTTSIDFKDGVMIQKKYNGVRYVTYLENNKIIQYSRTGSDYYPTNNLNSELLQLLTNLPRIRVGMYGIKNEAELALYTNPYLDGELYIHGKSLSYISGQARKEKSKDDLEYYIFDVFFPDAIANGYDMLSMHRQQYLDEMFNLHNTLQFVHRVQNYNVSSFKELNKLTESFIKEGYEGAIIRKNNKGYQYSYNNYHSSNVIKVKPIYSDEFNVVGFTEGKKGKDVGKIIWICELSNPKDINDKTFTVVPNLSLEEREKLYKCLISNNDIFYTKIKGLPLTIEYSELSDKTGKPLQAKAIAFRTYESGEDDPIKKIYKECGII